MTSWFDLNETDERRVAAFMTRVAELQTSSTVPDPMQLWWKAQLLRRWDAERRAQIPLDVIQPIEVVAGLGAAAFLIYLSIPLLFR